MKKLIAMLCFVTSVTLARAEPTEFTVHAAPGGPSDLSSRLITKYLPPNYIVVNRPGAGGQIAVKHMLDNPNSIINATMGQIFVTNDLMFKTGMLYKTNSIEVIGIVATMPNALVCNKKAPITSMEDFKKYLGRPLLFGMAGYGSSEHLATEVLFRIPELKVRHKVVPYATGGQSSVTDMLSGTIDCMFANYPTVKARIEDGSVNLLMTSENLGLNVTTWKDANKHDFPFTSPLGIIVSRSLPKVERDRIQNELKTVFANPDFIKELAGLGLNPIASIKEKDIMSALQNNSNISYFIRMNKIKLIQN